jgi:hypothetical protein
MIKVHKTKAGNRCDPILFAWRSKKYCHFVQSETYEACPEKNFYTYIYYYFKSWIALNKQSLIDVEITL